MRRHLADLGAAFAQVFAAPAYVVLATVLATVTLLLAVWLPNLGLIGRVLSGSDAPLADTLRFTLSLLGGIGTNFSALSAAYTVAIAVLFAVSTAMIAYLFTKKRAAAAGRNIALGSGGMASGVLGIGCAACSSLALQGALPLAGAAAALAALPLRGAEFGILGVALLLASLLLASRAIARPKGCALARGGPP